jgi:hypothetical protein
MKKENRKIKDKVKKMLTTGTVKKEGKKLRS